MIVNTGPAASTALKTSSLLRGWQAVAHTVGGTLETLIMAASSVTRDLRVAAPAELSPAVGACRGLRRGGKKRPWTLTSSIGAVPSVH